MSEASADNTNPAPPEANQADLSSNAKDAFLANDPNPTNPTVVEETGSPRLPAHETDEDPEEHMGRKTKDPWADPKQTDWPNNDELLSEPEEGDKA